MEVTEDDYFRLLWEECVARDDEQIKKGAQEVFASPDENVSLTQYIRPFVHKAESFEEFTDPVKQPTRFDDDEDVFEEMRQRPDWDQIRLKILQQKSPAYYGVKETLLRYSINHGSDCWRLHSLEVEDDPVRSLVNWIIGLHQQSQKLKKRQDSGTCKNKETTKLIIIVVSDIPQEELVNVNLRIDRDIDWIAILHLLKIHSFIRHYVKNYKPDQASNLFIDDSVVWPPGGSFPPIDDAGWPLKPPSRTPDVQYDTPGRGWHYKLSTSEDMEPSWHPIDNESHWQTAFSKFKSQNSQLVLAHQSSMDRKKMIDAMREEERKEEAVWGSHEINWRLDRHWEKIDWQTVMRSLGGAANVESSTSDALEKARSASASSSLLNERDFDDRNSSPPPRLPNPSASEMSMTSDPFSAPTESSGGFMPFLQATPDSPTSTKNSEAL